MIENKKPHHLMIDYTNYRGERRERRVSPNVVYWAGENHKYHQNCYVLMAFDFEKDEWREFRWLSIHSSREVEAIEI